MLSVAKMTELELENVRLVSVDETGDGSFKIVDEDTCKTLVVGTKIYTKLIATIIKHFNWEVTSESYQLHPDLFPTEDQNVIEDKSYRYLMQA